jgi:hypothetical protein
MSHVAAFTPISPEADAALAASYPRPLARNAVYEALLDGLPFKFPTSRKRIPLACETRRAAAAGEA